jgi:CRP-like cAMP-binding protein
MIVATSKRISRPPRISSLAGVDLFRDLPPSGIQELEKVSQVQDVPSGHIFFNPGDTGHGLFILEKGVVQTFRTLGTKKLVIVNLQPPEVFGEMGCIGKCQYLCLSKISKCLRGRELFPSAVHGECYSLNRTTRVEQLAALVDAGEHNLHDASVSTEQRSDANCKGPK